MPHAAQPDTGRSAQLPRATRLKRRRLIRPLFDRSRTDVATVATGSIRLLYRSVPRADTGENVAVQVGFAPGRGSRTAVQRNRIKRILREVYRVHQHRLVDLFLATPATLTLMVLYRGRPDQHAAIRDDLPRALARLADHLERRAQDPTAS